MTDDTDKQMLADNADPSNSPSRTLKRKPDWLRVPANMGQTNTVVMALMRDLNLNTVCEEAGCPNCGECFGRKTAAFMILGRQCTRHCRFCCVSKGCPQAPDPEEPDHLAEAVARLNLRHVVITSVTRDDLADGGADHFVRAIQAIRVRMADQPPVIEVLIPDLQGNWTALAKIVQAQPEIINHNLETIERLYPTIRPEADYKRSLELLRQVTELDPERVSKSGLMVGLGESETELVKAMADLRAVGCSMLTIGQYLAPSKNHTPVVAYIEPAQFERYRRIGEDMGFQSVCAGPLVRSSYQADLAWRAKSANRLKTVDARPEQC